ncbi:MAG: hypothetical protein WBV79_11360 [Rhodomicrobium sp.]
MKIRDLLSFSFTGTRKSPLNMFWLLLASQINAGARPERLGRRRDDGVANGFFPHIYQGLGRVEAALTCRKGAFAEDPSEEEMQTKASGTS